MIATNDEEEVIIGEVMETMVNSIVENFVGVPVLLDSQEDRSLRENWNVGGSIDANMVTLTDINVFASINSNVADETNVFRILLDENDVDDG